MDATTQKDQAEERIGKVTAAAGLKTFHSGGNGNTSLTKQDIERLEGLSRTEALAQVYEELANLLVLWSNLGGKITGITLPEGKQILAHRTILVLPAEKDEVGAYSLAVPE